MTSKLNSLSTLKQGRHTSTKLLGLKSKFGNFGHCLQKVSATVEGVQPHEHISTVFTQMSLGIFHHDRVVSPKVILQGQQVKSDSSITFKRGLQTGLLNRNLFQNVNIFLKFPLFERSFESEIHFDRVIDDCDWILTIRIGGEFFGTLEHPAEAKQPAIA